jgi:hypothetical protein
MSLQLRADIARYRFLLRQHIDPQVDRTLTDLIADPEARLWLIERGHDGNPDGAPPAASA